VNLHSGLAYSSGELPGTASICRGTTGAAGIALKTTAVRQRSNPAMEPPAPDPPASRPGAFHDRPICPAKDRR